MSASGAKVLMLRSVELARNHGVRVHARSTFSDEEGTWIGEEGMEDAIISGVTHNEQEVVFTLTGIPDVPGAAATVFDAVAAGGRQRRHDHPERRPRQSPSCRSRCRARTSPRPRARHRGGAWRSSARWTSTRTTTLGKVSLIGAGMRSHPGIAAKMFRTLADDGINLRMISTSPIKITCMIAKERDADRPARAAHGVRARPRAEEEEAVRA